MTLFSIAFGISLLVFLILYPWGGMRWKQTCLCIMSLVFAASYFNRTSLIILFVLLVSGYLISRYSQKTRRLNIGIIAYLIICITGFAIIKKYEVLNFIIPDTSFNHHIFIIGYSYLLFRQIHVIVDSTQQTIDDLGVIPYTIYCINFLTLLAGPIQRYQQFLMQWHSLNDHEITIDKSLQHINRIASGYIGLYVLSPFFLSLQANLLFYGVVNTSTSSIIHFYAYPLGVFFNFAGYCSIVIGMGATIGFSLPENFDKPYFALDPLDFWRRWHITLGTWLRDYIFFPFYRMGILRWKNRTNIVATIGYFITFLLAGIWHGTTFDFVILGLIYGGGAAIANLAEVLVKQVYGRKTYKQLRSNALITGISIVITWHFIAFSFLFLSTG